ncbi:histone deacetylase family protein [Pseudohalocynthiibacter aestuariivivens]|uniref:Histone deacetylase family protein n=1 Tax=Roseovarius pelagicus TaxID=2980108 RepID=A0ABY6DF74_9RHOB|nr:MULTISPECIES: histone deacetylase family protein [Rhodobacterales]QIE44476.1 histone deacetylase family protein [Pseudohalocynthiibacter aestuariivivens]UXX83623.1 histone deacetylase family protein [Roseovarius pelagicus]
MKAFFDARQLGHAPTVYFRRGAAMPHQEQPQRAEILRDMLIGEGFEISAPRDHGLAPIKAVHNPDYVDFLPDAHARFVESAGTEALAIPTTHPGLRRGKEPRDIHGQLGWWMTDTSTPLTAGTWEAAYWSAQTAIEAAEEVMSGARAAYALCRPPGHHAMRDCSNGFCFFNNACIVAHHMTSTFKKVALIDIDVHTGNGSLDILYERGDIFFCSLHPDPTTYPTFFLGHADETGEGEGAGKSLNILLEQGASEDTVLAALDKGIAAIEAFGADALVVSLGFDMAADDPLAGVSVYPEGFAEMARRLAAMNLPTALVQEGGYLGPSLADNAKSFLTTFREATR